ncbi:unnamed protein product [Ectocarpus sp. 12 AP-2014]
MVVSETTGKDSSRRGSSASPIRERLRRKPRQDWLITVGQGRSPARTLRRESKGRATSRSPGRSKKFDSARLSFGGLEQDPKARRSRSPPQADDGTPSSPTTPEPRSRKQRPGLSPSSTGSLKGRPLTSPMLLASVTSAATAPPTAASSTGKRRSPAFLRSAAGVDGDKAGSPFGRSVELRPPSPSSTPVSPSTAAAVPKTDWLAAAISGGRGESGGEEAAGAQTTTTTIAEGKFHSTGGIKVAAEERNAKLSSLLLLSPGKEYWADRLAAKGPRDSGSPQSLARSKDRNSSFGWGGEDVSSSPPARGQNDAPSYTDRGQQHQEGANGGPTSAGSPRKKDFRSFTAVKKVVPLSSVGGGGTSPSVWSTQAFTSPGGGGVAERRGRLDLSPWRARKPGQGLSPPRQASPSSSPRSLAKGDWRRGPAGLRPDQAGASRSLSPLAGGRAAGASRSLSPLAGGRAAGFGKTSSVRFGRGIDPLGAGFGAGSRGASSSTRQVSQAEPASPLLSLIGGYSSSSSSSGGSGARRPRATPSTLPSVTSGGGSGCGDATVVVAQDADGLEQATTGRPLCDGKPEEAADEASGDGGVTAGDDSAAAAAAVVQMPESCGAEEEEASADADDDGANGKAEGGALFAEREEASGEGRAEGDASDGTAGLMTVETKDFGETSGCTSVVNPAGAEHDNPLRPTLVVTSRPSPLRAQLQSPITQDPSPCTSDGLHFAVSDGIPPDGGPGGDAAGQLPPSPQATAAVVSEDSRPPLHGNGGGFTGHVPPGVRIVGRTAAGEQPGAASGGGSDGGGGGALAGEAPAGRRDHAALSWSPSLVCSEGGGTGPPRGGEVKLFVSTPTGEGDASDLSLWVTTRGSEEGGGEGAATSGDGAASPLPSPPSVRLSPVAVKSLEDDDPGIDAGDDASTAVDLEEEDLEKDLRNGLGFGAKNALEGRSGDGEGGASGEAENEAEALLQEEGATRCLLQPSVGYEAAEEAGGVNEGPETAVSQGEVENAAEGLSGPDVPLLDSSKTIPSTAAKMAANVEKTEVGGMEGPWEAVARVFCGIFNFCRPSGGEGGQGGNK